MQIQHLSHNRIDKQQWDRCIADAANGLIYAESFYLDTMCPGWEALVANDYSMVMPLPKRKKYGFSYLFQPFLTAQLGVFGNQINADIIRSFIDKIPTSFRLWDTSFNYANVMDGIEATVIRRNNFVLSIEKDHASIAEHYHDNIIRNINKAIKNACVVQKNISVDEIIHICRKEYPRFTKTEPGLFDQLKKVFEHYNEQHKAITYGVYHENKLLAGCAFLFFRNRAYYWLVGNEASARNLGASPLLIDTFIRDFSSKELLLDFEGSDDKGVAAFYKKFGAVSQPYHTIYCNRLPFPFKSLKPLPKSYQQLISGS